MGSSIRQRVPIELAKNRAHELLERLEVRLERGEIDEDRWYREVAAVITPAYLAANDPRAQSGHSGDAVRWAHARSLVANAVDRDGSFLDVGCANGHLMECMLAWARERGFELEPHGLDIASELAELARRRLPHWAERIHVGNAIDWQPPRRFEFVRTGLEYVPRRRRRDLVERLLREAVAPGGRLVVGTYNEERDAPPEARLEALVRSWGFEVAGRSERSHRDERLA